MRYKYVLSALAILFYSTIINAQNTLDRIGLNSTNPASVAFSLRQLSTGYTGPLVRIKVGTLFYDVYPDASTKFFTLNSKISASVSTYNATVSAASANELSTIITTSMNATVAIWYDQSGNAVNVLNSGITGAKIIIAGSIVELNGQPTIYFSDKYSYLISETSVDYSSQNAATLNAALQNIASISVISGIIVNGFNGGWGLIYDPTDTFKGFWLDGYGYANARSNEWTTDAKIVTGVYTKNKDSYIYLNSQLKGTRITLPNRNWAPSKIYVGARGDDDNRTFIGKISEVFIFPKSLSPEEQSSLESSQSIFILPSPPYVTITPSVSGVVCAGTSLTFTANAHYFTNTPTYQWVNNGVDIIGANASTYSNTSLTTNDQISVKANTSYNSNTIAVSILTTPIITTNGDACLTKTSFTTTFRLTSYAWYKDNVAITSATSNSYTPTASGVYRVTESIGTCSTTSAVTTIYTCGRTEDGKMSILETSTKLVGKDGAINNGYGVDDRGSLLAK